MNKMTEILTIFCIIVVFGLGFFSPASSPKEQIGLQFEGQIMSAELQGVSLRLILERLKNEKGIWFKGDESVLDESISIRFEDLPLHEGLRRILSNVNHVLVFDQERGLVGLFILGKKDPGKRSPRDGGVATGKSPPSQPVEEATVSRDPFGAKSIPDMSSGPESPFGEKTASSDEGPFSTSIFPPAERPSEDNIFPGSEGPSSD